VSLPPARLPEVTTGVQGSRSASILSGDPMAPARGLSLADPVRMPPGHLWLSFAQADGGGDPEGDVGCG